MGYICKNNGIYLQKLCIIFGKTIGYIGQQFGIYWAKTIDNFMGCIRQKLWDIFC